MKFQPDQLAGTNRVDRIDDRGIHIAGSVWTQPVVVPWRGALLPWRPAGFEALQPDDFAGLTPIGPEVVIFGSGARLRFPPPALLAALMQRRIGVETMDTHAACRTFNVLVAEGRHAVAALLPILAAPMPAA